MGLNGFSMHFDGFLVDLSRNLMGFVDVPWISMDFLAAVELIARMTLGHEPVQAPEQVLLCRQGALHGRGRIRQPQRLGSDGFTPHTT